MQSRLYFLRPVTGSIVNGSHGFFTGAVTTGVGGGVCVAGGRGCGATLFAP